MDAQTRDHDHGGEKVVMSSACSRETRPVTRRDLLDNMRVLFVGVSALAFAETSCRSAEAEEAKEGGLPSSSDPPTTSKGAEPDPPISDENEEGDGPGRSCRPPRCCRPNCRPPPRPSAQ